MVEVVHRGDTYVAWTKDGSTLVKAEGRFDMLGGVVVALASIITCVAGLEVEEAVGVGFVGTLIAGVTIEVGAGGVVEMPTFLSCALGLDVLKAATPCHAMRVVTAVPTPIGSL